MTRSRARWTTILGRAAGLVALAPGLAAADYELNMAPPVTATGLAAWALHNWMTLVCLAIFVGVFGVLGYSLYAHRRSRGHRAAGFHENTRVEMAWTVVPFLVLVVIAVPATRALVNLRDTSESDLTIKATGYQWKWGYDYLTGEGEGIRFLSVMSTPRAQIEGREPKGPHYLLEVDQPLVVPVKRKIRLLTTSNDVIHSWAVPAFGVKQDAVPGFIRDTAFRAEREGIYRGQCSELCGKDHGFMPVVVEVVSAERYTAWVAAQRQRLAAAADAAGRDWTLEESMALGAKVYATNCVACHGAEGRGIPGTFPALDGSAIVTGPVAAHIDIIANGKPGTAMAAFGAQLSAAELAAVVTWERNAWGNRTGDLVQPAAVTAARQ